MVRFARRRLLPADAASELGLARGERVLAWARLVGGGVAAATLGGIRVRTPRGALVARAWVDVEHAEWDAESRTMVIWWVGERRFTALEVADGGSQLPVAVRERVQSSVLLTSEVTLGGGRRVRLALRRDAAGALSTQALPPPGMDLSDPADAAAVQRAMAALRAQAGADGFDSLQDARGDPA